MYIDQHAFVQPEQARHPIPFAPYQLQGVGVLEYLLLRVRWQLLLSTDYELEESL